MIKTLANRYIIFPVLCFIVVLCYACLNNIYAVEKVNIYAIAEASSSIEDITLKAFTSKQDNTYFNIRKIPSKPHKSIPLCGENSNHIDFITNTTPFKSAFKTNADNSICVSDGETNILLYPLFEPNWYYIATEKITEILATNASILFAYDPVSNKIIGLNTQDERVKVDFSFFKKFVIIKLAYAVLFSFLCGLATYFVLKFSYPIKFLRSALKFPIVYFSSFFFVLLVYAIVYPGIFGMDLVVQHSYRGSITGLYSIIYSIFTNIFSSIHYNFIVIIGISLFLFSFLLPLVLCGKMNCVKQILIACYILFCTITPAAVISIFGIQRIPTTNMFFLAFIASCYTTLRIHENRITLLNISIVLLVITCLLRFEYIIFIVPLIYCFKKCSKDMPWLTLKKILPALGITLILFTVILQIRQNSKEYETLPHQYKAIALNAYLQPYLHNDKNSGLHAYFYKNMHDGEVWKLTKSEYKNALKYFCNKLITNPKPYFDGALSRFSHAMLSPDTWGHSYNKYILAQQDWSWHHLQAFGYFLTQQEISPAGRNLYDAFINHSQNNTPFFRNGILISLLFMFIIAPPLLRKKPLLLAMNTCMILKFIFVLLLSPAGYALYYYDISLWMLISIYLLVIEKHQARIHIK